MTDRIDASLRDAPVIDRGGYAYVIHPLTDGVPRVDAALLEQWTDWAAQDPLVAQATVLLAPEAMAIPLATALSLRTGIPFLVVRKRQYGLEGETVAYCETGYGQNCLYVNDLRPDDGVLVIDDVISTGGTLQALLATLKGMDAKVLGALAFLDKGGRSDALSASTGVPVKAMRAIDVAGDQVTVRPVADP